MANQARQIETDDDEGGGAQQGVPDRLTPQRQPSIRAVSNQNEAEEEFDILEVDDNNQPLDGGQRQQPQEGRLTEDESGQRPVIEQQEDENGQPRGTRAEERRQRRQRQRQARDGAEARERAMRAEIEDLRARLEGTDNLVRQVEPRLTEISQGRRQDQLAQLDNQLAQADQRFQAAERAIRDAIVQGPDGADALLVAMQQRDEAALQRYQIRGYKQQLETQPAPRQQQTQPQGQVQQRQPAAVGLPPQAKSHYDRFVADNNDWFDPNGSNEESRIAMSIDEGLVADGYDMNTPAYWNELNKRLEKRLPDIFAEEPAPQPQQRRQAANGNGARQQQQATPAIRRGPATAGSGERSGGSNNGGRKQVVLNPARRATLVQAGVIDSAGTILDKAKFSRIIKGYSDFDAREGAV